MICKINTLESIVTVDLPNPDHFFLISKFKYSGNNAALDLVDPILFAMLIL
jgi:hypothetical protein